MSVAKIIELSARSDKGFDDAIRQGIAQASETVDHIQGAWVEEQKVVVENGQIKAFEVIMKVTFVLNS
jgi:flavin-binding protein dodecin